MRLTSLVGLDEDGLGVHAGQGQGRRHAGAHAGEVIVEAPQVHRLHTQVCLRASMAASHRLSGCAARFYLATPRVQGITQYTSEQGTCCW